MRCLLVATLTLLISSTANSKETWIHSIPHYIQTAARAFDIDPALMYAICKVESRCTSVTNKNDGTSAQKREGVRSPSHGLFQIKLATARSLGFNGKVAALLQPGVNSYYAAKLLSHIYARQKTAVRVLSVYNAGHYTKSNNKYVLKVIKEYVGIKLDRRS